MINSNDKIIQRQLLEKLFEVRKLQDKKQLKIDSIKQSLPTSKNSMFGGTKTLSEKQFNKNFEIAVSKDKDIKNLDKEIKKLQKHGEIRAFKCTYKLKGFNDELFSLTICCDSSINPYFRYGGLTNLNKFKIREMWYREIQFLHTNRKSFLAFKLDFAKVLNPNDILIKEVVQL